MANNPNGIGGFVKGVSGNPNGRPRKDRESRFYEVAVSSVTFKDWREIIERAVSQAKRGDTAARKFLADYLMGVPVQKMEHGGSDGEPIKICVSVLRDDELSDTD